MNGLVALAAAHAEFEWRLRLVDEEAWERPTPCDAWDVRALVNHVVGGNVRYTMLLGGAGTADVEATRNRDHLADDAVGAFVATARGLLAKFETTGDSTRQYRHALGERSGRELLDMRVLDVTVHAWDLASGIETDTAIDPMLIEYALTCTRHLVAGRRSGAFAPAADVEPTSSQQRLLALTGRIARHTRS